MSCSRLRRLSSVEARQVAALAEDARVRFESRYERFPSWEVPYPQPAFVALAEAGEISGLVVDAGCGSGENALYLLERGHEVWGVDVAPSAIGLARAKARRRGLPETRFVVGDALRLDLLGLTCDTVIDSGLFHALTNTEQALYERSLRAILRPGGRVHILCFSDEEPGDDGPRRVSRAELRSVFGTGGPQGKPRAVLGTRGSPREEQGGCGQEGSRGNEGATRSRWREERLEEARFMTNTHPGGARAWVATLVRGGTGLETGP